MSRRIARLVLGLLALSWMALAAPLRAQDTRRPTPREGADTTCAPNYDAKHLGDSAVAKAPDTGRIIQKDTRPPCPKIGDGSTKPSVGVDRGVAGPVAPLSAKGDSLRRQADSGIHGP